MTESDRRPDAIVRDAAVMRAMAHPARIAILEFLGAGAQATATECAEVCGLSPSATSYHLRELAKAGLVAEAPGRGDGRERRWRGVSGRLRIDSGDDHSPEASTAALALLHVILNRDEDVIRRWLARISTESEEWSRASAIVRTQLTLTAAELVDLTERLDALVEPYTARSRPDPPAGARTVAFMLRAVPTNPEEAAL